MSEANLINESELPADSQTTRIRYVEPATAPTGTPPRFTGAFRREGFFGKLFDTRFADYATPSIVKVVYWIAIVGAALSWILTIFNGGFANRFGFAGFSPLGIISGLLFGWIPTLAGLILLRIGLEAVIALIRLSKDTRRIRHHLENQR